MSDKSSVDPYFMYQCRDGEVCSQLFTDPEPPQGWYDSHKAAKSAYQVIIDAPKKKKKIAKKPIKKEEVLEISSESEVIVDGDSSGNNQ